jgi:hypothetical protein
MCAVKKLDIFCTNVFILIIFYEYCKIYVGFYFYHDNRFLKVSGNSVEKSWRELLYSEQDRKISFQADN